MVDLFDLSSPSLPSLRPDLACACDEDSESVCSSQDGSVLSDDGVPGVVLGGAEEVEEGDVQSQLAEQVDLLGDKKLVRVCVCVWVCMCMCVCRQNRMCN